jgi:hypothetical protein
MELASVIGGEGFSARPECVPPTLAAVARLVNDHVSDERRQHLVRLLPRMMSGPEEDRRIGWLLVLSCLDTAHRLGPRRNIRRQQRRAIRALSRLDRPTHPWQRWVSDVRFRVASFRAVYAATWLAIGAGDDALVTLLKDAVDTYTSVTSAAAPQPVESAVGDVGEQHSALAVAH